MKKFISLILFVFALQIASYAQQEQKLSQDIDKYVNEVVATWQLPGMAVAISLDNKVILSKGYGLKEVAPEDGVGFRGVKNEPGKIVSGGYPAVWNAPNKPIDENTVFQIGSVSKSFTATVMAELVDEGLLKWSDTVKNILPDFKYYDPWVTENMQVIDIMTHRSGLAGQAGTYFPNIGYDREDMYKMLALVKPTYSFRGDYEYNNTTFVIASKIIEKLTGKSWEENVKERIFDKLGMKNSSLNAEGFSNSKNVATPHDYSYTTMEKGQAMFPELVAKSAEEGKIIALPLYGDEQALNWLTEVGPAGSVNSSVADMIKYAQMHMNNGFIVEGNDTIRVKSESAIKRIHRGVTITSQDVNRTTLYAQCWFVEQNNRYRLYFHTGTTWGMTALCFFVPEIKLCGVVLVNSEAGSSPRYAIMRRAIDLVMGAPERDYNKEYFTEWIEDKRESWAKMLKEEEVERGNPIAERLLVGRYEKDELFGNAEITKERDGLYIAIGKRGYKNRLVHIKDNEYHFRSDGHAYPIVFDVNEKGKVIGFTVKFNYNEEETFGGWIKK